MVGDSKKGGVSGGKLGGRGIGGRLRGWGNDGRLGRREGEVVGD